MRLLEVSAPEALEALSACAQHVDPTARCNSPAVEAGLLDLTYPSVEQLEAYAGREDHVILAAGTPRRVHGYAVVRDDGRMRWLVLDDGLSKAASVVTVRMLAEETFTRFGACFGRVSNDALRALLVDGLDEVHERDSELHVLEWRKS